MMNPFKKNIPVLLLASAISVSLASCVAKENYKRPENMAEQNLYRTDKIPTDSLSTANVPWNQIFTDPILQKHISKALSNNLDIRIALQNIAAAQAYLKQAQAAYYPTLSIGPEIGTSATSLNSYAGKSLTARTWVNQGDITASAGWEADIWGKLKSQEKAQYAQLLSSTAAHQAVKSNLVEQLASDYYQLLMLDEEKRVLQKSIENRTKNLETTKALKTAGTLTEAAVQQSEALVYNAQSAIISLDLQTKQMENAICLLMGEASHDVERSTLDVQHFPQDFDTGYPANLLENRPDVRQAEFDLMNAFELTNYAKAQFYPSLKITANGGLQSTALDNFFSVNSLFANVIGGLTEPIFNHRQIKTQYEVSLANKEKAYLNFRKSILTAGREVSDALAAYNSQDQFISLKQKEFTAYQNSVEMSQELVNYGMANYLEVLNADVNRLNAELNIINAKYNKLNSGVQLYHALGGGWR